MDKKKEQEKKVLEFYGGDFGAFIPLIIALIFIIIAAVNQAKIDGYVVAFFSAIVLGVVFAKDEKAYGDAIIKGLQKPMFPTIALAVLLAAVSGAFVSKSGLIETLVYYIVSAGFSAKLYVAMVFLITCVIAFSTGTSVGTYFVVAPILYPIGYYVGAVPAFTIGAIAAGAAFGDNLAPISDTTIASATSQGKEVGEVVKSRLKYAIPVGIIAFFVYLFFTKTISVTGGSMDYLAELQASPITLIMLLVPIIIIYLCIKGKHLLTALSYGIITGTVVGIISGVMPVSAILSFPGPFNIEGIFIESIIGAMPTIAFLLAIFPLLGILEQSGAIRNMTNLILKFATNERRAETAIVASVGLISMITGVISVAILAVAELVNELGEKFDMNGCRRANLMDCSGVAFCFMVPWTVHAIIPAMMTSNIEGVPAVMPISIPLHNFYSITMIFMLVFAITTGYGREKG